MKNLTFYNQDVVVKKIIEEERCCPERPRCVVVNGRQASSDDREGESWTSVGEAVEKVEKNCSKTVQKKVCLALKLAHLKDSKVLK